LQTIATLPSALDHIAEFASRLSDKPAVLFLDYDGTLSPIVARPELAGLSDEMRQVVSQLARCCTVAIVSGRALADVQQLVGLDSLIYAGSHGFSIAGPPGSSLQHEVGAEFEPAAAAAEAQLKQLLQGIDGLLIERKECAVAVHYRLVAETLVPTVARAVEAALAARPTLRKSSGKRVLELRPSVDWHKGRAVQWILDQLDGADSDTVPIYIGDDITDEDAFVCLPDHGIGVVVGSEPRPTAAQYKLLDTNEVYELLKQLARLIGG